MNDVSIVLCGDAGQGIQTVEQLFINIVKKEGFNVFSTKEYMSRVRGGSNSTQLRISTEPVTAYINRIDILIPLSEEAITHLGNRVSKKTIIIGEKNHIKNNKHFKGIEIPFSQYAKEIGNIVFSNTIAVGLLSALCGIDKKTVTEQVENYFSKKKKDLVKNNILAAEKGYAAGEDLVKKRKAKLNISSPPQQYNDIVLNGTQAIGLGALAGGCNFISSYPMSPSTGVLTFLSQQQHNDFDIIVEQAEDEISAINMALGAWYAGARAMVTTSGGGYALMTEGVSLAGMIESPMVIHLAQRPAPATGLPTRTEQADLELALYSSHGEFPKIIFAPGTLQDGFYLTQRAFNLADKYQVPVYILTDQYFVDSYYNIPSLTLESGTNKRYFVKIKKTYKRYEFTKNGISPRGIPGYGDGLVCVDSDEHDEEGRITESMTVRTRMVDKRLRKLKEITKETIPPTLIGNKNYKTLIIGWGSTYHIIKEALKRINRKNISFLHFTQLYPLHSDTVKYLKKAQQTIIVENNATSQFSNLIKRHTGHEINYKILQYNGLPFSVEAVENQIKKISQRYQ
ncbi:MAG TPA: 2-oxoacid:acceptor oxidoreductase subunit alpha [Candidatus Thermoplasmatota archaeon]|nr:2-oxoacid:acceptor oxidoreductase subunit alpha [Candidatus Thermoplasmatota archaeon]